ncbi:MULTISPECIES: FecR domain-containing protein [Microbulbifer]|uniref:FecR family protein n=1 Tax=Microbulbifer TaxID=48073 RepID=UPI001E539D99|nr:FecR domain-containing protein [Microbulbifer sp. YPW16]UHQ54741.1 FecR domain-containing protein [Microbulbifer sp. YPW16]
MNSAGGQINPSEEQLDQACAWIARLRSDAVSAADRREFASWIGGSAANRRAFDEMSGLWGDLGALGHMPIDQLFPESLPTVSTRPAPEGRRKASADNGGWGWAQWLSGGGLVAACLVVTLWVGNQWLAEDAVNQQVYTTVVGETRTVTLTDGTRVQLNTNSELQVSYSREERRTTLLRGEAFFDVERQTARPFTVAAGKAKIRVLGTEFNVERNPDNTRVSVTGGVVSVSESSSASGLRPESVKLVKNQKVSVSGSGLGQVSATSADEALDWTRGVLVFDRTPLEEALEELNRYLPIPAAADASVRERKLSGTFELSDPDNTLKAIAAALDLQEDRSNPDLTLLSPKPN